MTILLQSRLYGDNRISQADRARFYKRLGEMEALRAPPLSR